MALYFTSHKMKCRISFILNVMLQPFIKKKNYTVLSVVESALLNAFACDIFIKNYLLIVIKIKIKKCIDYLKNI